MAAETRDLRFNLNVKYFLGPNIGMRYESGQLMSLDWLIFESQINIICYTCLTAMIN